MKSMTYTVLEFHAYDKVKVVRYFCTTTNFSRTYVRMYSNFSNPDCFYCALVSCLVLSSKISSEQ